MRNNNSKKLQAKSVKFIFDATLSSEYAAEKIYHTPTFYLINFRLEIEVKDSYDLKKYIAQMINPFGLNNLQNVCGTCGEVTIKHFNDGVITPSQSSTDTVSSEAQEEVFC